MNKDIQLSEGPEQHALSVLWGGLANLNARMTKLEQEQSKQFRPKPKSGQIMLASAWNHPDHLLPNYFFWYATNAYNFLTLFAHTYVLTQPSPKTVREEVEKAFPEVVAWRHKIGAHLSHVFPRDPKTNKDDPPAARDNSILLIVDFEIDPKNVRRGRFWISKSIISPVYDPVDPTTHNQGACPNWGWALTGQHELVEAYVGKYL